MKNILVHSGAGIGDIILMTPVITALAKAGHTIDWLIDSDTSYDVASLYQSWPVIRRLYRHHAEVESGTYDCYFMAAGVIRPVKLQNRDQTTIIFAAYPEQMRAWIPIVDTYFAYAKMIEPGLKAHHETYCGYSPRLFPEVTKKTVVLFPGCGKYYPMKRWDKFSELADRLSDVAVVGTEEDMDLSHSYFYPDWIRNFFSGFHYDGIVTKTARFFGKRYNRPFKFGKHVKNYIGQLNLADTAALIKQAGLLIGNDGGITHMAAALDIPTVAIFGPTSPIGIRVHRKNILYISKNLDCQPCLYGGKYPKAFQYGYVGCPIGMKCLTGISVDDVYEQAMKFFYDNNRRGSQ